MTRLLGHHPRIDVDLDARGQPARLRWEGGSVPGRGVQSLARRRGVVAPAGQSGLLQAGRLRLLALVYLDRVDGTWHLERVFD